MEAAGSKTVLILDADPGLRRFVAKLLEPSGFLAAQVRSDHELLAALRSLQPSLIIIDFAIAETSRFDLIGLLRRHPAWRRIPLVVVSDEHAMAFPVRVDAPIVYKPDKGGLADRIDTALRPN
jgi:CheY-like chemotaxis protein